MLNLAVYKVRTAQYTHSVSVIKASQLMLYREIIAVCSEIHTKHINTLCGQNIEFVNVKPGGTWSNRWALTRTFFHIFHPSTRNCPTRCLPFRYSAQNSACICRLFHPHNKSHLLHVSSSTNPHLDLRLLAVCKERLVRNTFSIFFLSLHPTLMAHCPLKEVCLVRRFGRWLYSRLQVV
jgi:hypothetical protein